MPDYNVTYRIEGHETLTRANKIYKNATLIYAEGALELERKDGVTMALFAPGEWFKVCLAED